MSKFGTINTVNYDSDHSMIITKLLLPLSKTKTRQKQIITQLKTPLTETDISTYQENLKSKITYSQLIGLNHIETYNLLTEYLNESINDIKREKSNNNKLKTKPSKLTKETVRLIERREKLKVN